MKTYGGVQIHVFLISALAGGGQLHAPAHRATQWLGDCVNHRADVDDVP
jgi:hypothetical protein